MLPQQLYVLKVSGRRLALSLAAHHTARGGAWQPHKPQGLVFARFNKNKNLDNCPVAAYKQTVLVVEQGGRGKPSNNVNLTSW